MMELARAVDVRDRPKQEREWSAKFMMELARAVDVRDSSENVATASSASR